MMKKPTHILVSKSSTLRGVEIRQGQMFYKGLFILFTEVPLEKPRILYL